MEDSGEEGRELLDAGTPDPEDPAATIGGDHIVEKKMKVQLGAYSSVFVAALGQVTYSSPGDVKALLHPCKLLVLAMPLFICQLTAIFSLRADIVQSERISVINSAINNSTSSSDVLVLKHSAEDIHVHAHLSLKLLFIVIVQVMYFDYIMNTSRTILFLLNPLVWVELRTDKKEEWEDVPNAGLFRKTIHMIYTYKVFLLLPALFAMYLRFQITWLVIVDSISIILVGEKVEDTIFDCLAITFLLELNAFWWKILHTVFHLEPLDATEVTVQYNQGVWKTPCSKRSELSELGRDIAICPRVVNFLSKNLPLRDGHGGRWSESVIVSMVAYFLAMRQFALVSVALDTNISPMARDVCWEWRAHQESQVWNRLWKWFITNVMFVDVKHLTDDIVKDTLGQDACSPGGKYTRTEMSDVIRFFWKQPGLFCAIAVVLFLVFFTPIVMDQAPKKFCPIFMKPLAYSRVEPEKGVASTFETADEEQQKKQ